MRSIAVSSGFGRSSRSERRFPEAALSDAMHRHGRLDLPPLGRQHASVNVSAAVVAEAILSSAPATLP